MQRERRTGLFLFSIFIVSFLATGPHTARAGIAVPSVAAGADREKGAPIENFLMGLSAREGAGLTGRASATGPAVKELDRIAKRVSDSLVGNRQPNRVISAMNRVLFREEGFVYDPGTGDPENFLLDRVVSRRRGNCLGLTVVYLSLADRLEFPVRAVYVPSHSFVRYEGDGVRINIETGENGIERKDGWYVRKYRLREGSPYLRALGRTETIGLYLNSLGTACSRKDREEEALRWYGEASRYYPGLPDIHYNAGVSYQRLGRNRDAIDRYRNALSLYTEMAAARGNLGAALCSWGRVEDGIKEFLKALEIDPACDVASAGLAKAYITRGDYRAAIEHCDMAMKQGCRFEPSLLEALDRYRTPVANPVN